MSLNAYLAPLKKWWWLLVVAAVVASASSLVILLIQPPVYQVRTTLVVGNVLDAPNPSGGEFYFQLQLAGIYAQIAYREDIQKATREALGLTWLPQYTVRAIPNAPMIEIVVNDTDPTRTMVVANELADQLIKRSPNSANENPELQTFLSEMLVSLQDQINETRNEIARLQEQQSSLTGARQIADSQLQIGELQTRLAQLQASFNDTYANSNRGATNTLTVIEVGALPTQPVGSNRIVTIFLAGVVGLMMAAVAAYGIEFLDDSIKSVDDFKRLYDIPVVGQIAEFPSGKDPWTYVIDEPRSPVAHSFRILRTNLDLADNSAPLRTILITSAGMSEGKSTIAANLAMVMSQADRCTISMDADFHRPILHHALEIDNEFGLSDVFKGSMYLQDVLVPWRGDKLQLIPAGKMPANPSELLGSTKMDEILNSLKEMADVVIVDGPPFFLADAAVLATKVDCVIIVIRLGHTRREAMRAIKEQLELMHATRVVAVFNRVSPHETYYSKYYSNEYRSTKA